MSFPGIIKKICRGRNSNAGTSLVEVMVSGIFIAISVVAVVSVLGTGSRLQVSDNFRRQARTIIKSHFEQQYDFNKKNAVAPAGTHNEQVVIDERSGSPLSGELFRQSEDITISVKNGSLIPAQRVRIWCRWNSDASTTDSVLLTKIIATAKP